MDDRSRQINRYLDGGLEAIEIEELLAWLAESPQNAEVFAQHCLIDRQLSELFDSGLSEQCGVLADGEDEAVLLPTTSIQCGFMLGICPPQQGPLCWLSGLPFAPVTTACPIVG